MKVLNKTNLAPMISGGDQEGSHWVQRLVRVRGKKIKEKRTRPKKAKIVDTIAI